MAVGIKIEGSSWKASRHHGFVCFFFCYYFWGGLKSVTFCRDPSVLFSLGGYDDRENDLFLCDTNTCKFDGECLRIGDTVTCVCQFKVRRLGCASPGALGRPAGKETPPLPALSWRLLAGQAAGRLAQVGGPASARRAPLLCIMYLGWEVPGPQ